MRMSLFASTRPTASTTNPAAMGGRAGPMDHAITSCVPPVMAPSRSANGAIGRVLRTAFPRLRPPSASPNQYVRKNTPSRPQNTYVIPVMTPDHAEIIERNSPTPIEPDSAGSITAPVPRSPAFRPPNGGFGALKKRPNTAAASGGNPRPMKRARRAHPGVPNPAAPSMIVMKPRPMSST